jgi:kumamolisin
MAVRKKARSRSQLAKSASGRKKIPGKTAAAEENRVEAPGSQRPPAKGAVRIKDADPRSKVEVTLTLRGPKLPGADQLSGRALAPKAVETRFSAPRRDADRVSQVLRKFGLKIEEVSLETRSMRVSGSVAMMEAAFHPGLGIYRNADQGEFRDRQGDYKIPAELKGIVTAVLGFGERRVVRRKPANATKIVHRLTPLTPADLERYYSFPHGDAAGQKIAIAEFGGGYFASDLSAYCKKFHRLVPTVKAISIGAPIRTLKQILRLPKARRQDELDSSGEVMMDVQIVAGLCPGAAISVYFAKFIKRAGSIS